MKANFLYSIIAFSHLSFSFATVETSQEARISNEQKSVSVFLMGTGVVGSALLDQIERNHLIFQERYNLDIRVVGIANSHEMLLNGQGIDLKEWRSDTKEPLSWELYLDQMLRSPLPNLVFVDCTSNQAIADSYRKILQSGISVVTPNKKANSGSFDAYRSLRGYRASFLYDANVGAGLPILSTVQGLQRSGDRILKIEAILSGTLSYLFNSFESGAPFSDLVKEAQNMGYTEPDPRDDLNGMDVARKLLILAREAGYPLEMKDIRLKRFLPNACFDAPSIDAFYVKLKDFDSSLSEMRRKAAADGKRLRYIASLENGRAEISLCAVGPEHPFYSLSGNDNIVSIQTEYYSKNPLVIRGPGAGAAVTAARVLEDIVRIGLEK